MDSSTAWMIRRDGSAFPCSCHYYGDGDDVEQTLYAAEWLYKHTTQNATKRLILNLISLYGESLDYPGDTVRKLLLDTEDKDYNFLTADFVLDVAELLPTQANGAIQDLNEAVIEALNDEFLRARLGGMYDTVEDCRDMFFRVSGSGFDWTAVIKRFVRENAARIDNITVLWDYESIGRKDFFKDEKGRDINKIPISEFI